MKPNKRIKIDTKWIRFRLTILSFSCKNNSGAIFVFRVYFGLYFSLYY